MHLQKGAEMSTKILEIIRAQPGIDQTLLLNMLGGLQHRVHVDALVAEGAVVRLTDKSRGTRLTLPHVQLPAPKRRPKRTQTQIAADTSLTFRVYQLEQRLNSLEAALDPETRKLLGL